jgi:hypothetical protein
MISNNKEQALINLIHVQEGLVRELSNITERLEYEDSNLSVLVFYHYFGHNYIMNFYVILVILESRHPHISIYIW